MVGDATEFQLTMNQTEKSAPSPSFLLHTESGFPIVFAGYDSAYHVNDVVCTAERGRASILSGGSDVRVELKAAHEHFSGFQRLKEVEPDMLNGPEDDMFSEALSDLIRAHETNTKPASNLWTARSTQELMTRIRSSGQIV